MKNNIYSFNIPTRTEKMAEMLFGIGLGIFFIAGMVVITIASIGAR